MFAFVFGTNNTSDAYLQAFLIPDLIFNIVAGGALSSAFIPVFSKYMTSEQDEKSALGARTLGCQSQKFLDQARQIDLARKSLAGPDHGLGIHLRERSFDRSL